MLLKLWGFLFVFLFLASFAVVPALAGDRDCETCPMMVDAEAQRHIQVTDANGNVHYVECIGCALKLLKTCDTLHIETFCDWYGPDYKVVIDITESGASSTVNPSTAVTLIGGGCTGNRVAYNQTAAEALLANGYSENTMTMMRQALPPNTNITSISARALTFVNGQQVQSSQLPATLICIGAAGIALLMVVIVIIAKKR